MGIKSWTDYFLDLAKTCSSRSNCLRAQVGAVIVGVDKKLRPQVIMALLPAWNLAMNAANATVLKIISRLEPVTKPAVLYTLSRMLLFRPVRIGVWVLQCIFTDIILSVFCVKDLLFSPELLNVYLKKDDNSPIIHVSVDDIKRELDNPGVGVNEVVKS